MWVDDIIVAASSTLLLNEIKQHLSSKFNIKDLGPLSSFLSIHFEQKEDVTRVDRLRGNTCPYVCPQTGLN